MLDYKNFLEENDFSDMQINIKQSDKHIEIFGDKKGLLYLASRIMEFIEEDSDDEYAELNFDTGVDLTNDSSSLCVFVSENDDLPKEISEEMLKKAEDAIKKKNYK